MMKALLLMLFLPVLIWQSSAYFVTIDAHSEECFYEKIVETGAKVG